MLTSTSNNTGSPANSTSITTMTNGGMAISNTSTFATANGSNGSQSHTNGSINGGGRGQVSELTNRGYEEASKGNFRCALDWFSSALEIDPRDHVSLANRSVCYFQLSRYEEALRDAEKVIRVKPTDPKGYVLQSRALTRLRRLSDAERTLLQALQLTNGNGDAKGSRDEIEKELIKVQYWIQSQSISSSSHQSSPSESLNSSVVSSSFSNGSSPLINGNGVGCGIIRTATANGFSDTRATLSSDSGHSSPTSGDESGISSNVSNGVVGDRNGKTNSAVVGSDRTVVGLPKMPSSSSSSFSSSSVMTPASSTCDLMNNQQQPHSNNNSSSNNGWPSMTSSSSIIRSSLSSNSSSSSSNTFGVGGGIPGGLGLFGSLSVGGDDSSNPWAVKASDSIWPSLFSTSSSVGSSSGNSNNSTPSNGLFGPSLSLDASLGSSSHSSSSDVPDGRHRHFSGMMMSSSGHHSNPVKQKSLSMSSSSGITSLLGPVPSSIGAGAFSGSNGVGGFGNGFSGINSHHGMRNPLMSMPPQTGGLLNGHHNHHSHLQNQSNAFLPNGNGGMNGPSSLLSSNHRPLSGSGPSTPSPIPPNSSSSCDYARVQNILQFKAVFVDGVSPSVRPEELRQLFSSYGAVVSVEVKPVLGNSTPTFACVEYADFESPENSVTDAMNNPIVREGVNFSSEVPLAVKFTPSGAQRRSLSTGCQARNWAQSIIERSGECFEWRFNSSCSLGKHCFRKHVVKHRQIDTLKSFTL